MHLTERDYAIPSAQGLVGSQRNPTLVERLTDQKASLTQQLARVDEALAALNEHPEVMKVLELVSKV